jgi:hypothetical protein
MRQYTVKLILSRVESTYTRVPLNITSKSQWHTQESFFGGGVMQRIFFLGGGRGYANNFFGRGGGIQQIQLGTEGRENGDLWVVAPQSGVPLNLQMSEAQIPIRLLWMYFPWNW